MKTYDFTIRVIFSEEKDKLNAETLKKQLEKKLSNGNGFPISYQAKNIKYIYQSINYEEIKTNNICEEKNRTN